MRRRLIWRSAIWAPAQIIFLTALMSPVLIPTQPAAAQKSEEVIVDEPPSGWGPFKFGMTLKEARAAAPNFSWEEERDQFLASHYYGTLSASNQPAGGAVAHVQVIFDAKTQRLESIRLDFPGSERAFLDKISNTLSNKYGRPNKVLGPSSSNMTNCDHEHVVGEREWNFSTTKITAKSETDVIDSCSRFKPGVFNYTSVVYEVSGEALLRLNSKGF